MKLRLKRTFLGEEYTIGHLYYYDKEKKDYIYFCDTLEDKVRDLNKDGKFDNGEVKIYGRTAIPYGTYQIILTWSPKFQRKLPLLLNVNSFEYIRIHAGNDKDDTEGCILLGFNKIKGKVINSKETLDKFLILLDCSKDSKHEIEII